MCLCKTYCFVTISFLPFFADQKCIRSSKLYALHSPKLAKMNNQSIFFKARPSLST